MWHALHTRRGAAVTASSVGVLCLVGQHSHQRVYAHLRLLLPCCVPSSVARQQLYMNQREVITILHQHARVEPDFTALVWEKLEEQNAEFFSAYYTRLRLKEQILAFNTLLEQHAGVIDKMHATGSPIIGLGHHDHGVAHDPSAASQLLLGGGIHHAHAHHGAGLAMAAGEAKLSTSGLLLDRRGAFLSAGDYLMDGPHPPHLGHTPPMATGPGSLVGGHSHHHLDLADGSHLLHNLPRNFSLSDLSLDMAAQMAGDMSLLDDGLGHGAPSQR